MDELTTYPSCGAIARGDHCTQCGMEIVGSTTAEMLSVEVPGLDLDGVVPDTPPRPAEQPANAQSRQGAAAYLVLQPSETAVLHAASRLMAGFIANGQVTADNELEQSDRAVRLATRMALVIEKYVQSDNEDW